MLDAWNTGLNKSSFRREKLMNYRKSYLVTTLIATAAVLLLASSCTTSANHDPIIVSLLSKPERATPSGTVQVVCTASDPDGDELSYDWSASAGELSGDGNTVTWSAPASEGSYSVAVAVTDGRGGEAMDYKAITVRTNNPPTITTLTAAENWTTPLGAVQVACTASDPDGDELSYNWTVTGGNISGTGAVVNWIAPQAVGTYNITVVVTDGYGGEAARSISLSVAPGTVPTIEKLCVSPKGHVYLRKSTAAGCDYDVWRNMEYDIECVASNAGGGLSYDWSCTAGNVSGSGSNITWTAPNELSVAVTVTVTVSDIGGNRVAESMILYVPSCTCGSWGLELGCK
jgi:hypothetical protein